MAFPVNRFKRDLLAGRQMLGVFATLGSPALVELLGGCGFDWVMIDTEHSPTELSGVVDHLRALDRAGAAAVVRPPWADMVMTKRLLDFGVQTILFPYIQMAAEAALAVSYTRYPPAGLRGVSGASRGAGYGLIDDYFPRIDDEICTLVQIETREALDALEAIAAVPGVDGVLIGPADLAASMGHIGQTTHPAVRAVIDDAFARLRAIGKPSGFITNDPAEAARRAGQGVGFVGVANDTALVIGGARAVLRQVRAG
jgi:4-hydroxy-2-oxoheptanedioate aldolase